MDKKYTFVDLFAGCGGLSEGFYKQNFDALAHVEIDHWACETLKTRMHHYKYKDAESSVLEKDITDDDVNDKLDELIKKRNVDLIIGGPPCQSFSSLGRAKDDHRMQNDPRNYLFESYIKVLHHLNPKVFVLENVTGLLSAKLKGKHIVNKILKELGERYDLISDPKKMVLNSANYGVPQIRKRVIIIGVRKDLKIKAQDVYDNIVKTHYTPDEEKESKEGLKKFITVKDAISNLPALQSGEGSDSIDFTYSPNNSFLKIMNSCYDGVLRHHVARGLNDTDILRYAEMSKNNWTFSELLEKRPDLRHPKRRVFNNSYTVQWWNFPSKTIIAHLYKDGNQFIHPDYKQGRSITPREAARLQSFPDNFIFEGSRTEIYKQIGNAVPPLFAEAIAKSIKHILRKYDI